MSNPFVASPVIVTAPSGTPTAAISVILEAEPAA